MNYENLVLSGGGVRGYAYIGIIKALYEKEIIQNIKHILGCSAGSFFGLLLCLKYSYEEIHKTVVNISLENKLSFFKNDCDFLTTFFENYGIDSGDDFLKIIKVFIKSKIGKNDITFKELYDYNNVKFTVTTTNLTKNQVEYFNHILTPDVSVLKVIRISVSIPLIFTPIIHNDEYYVDGGLTNNFPIEYLEDEIDKTIGVSLNNKMTNKIDSLITYINAVLKCNYNRIDFEKMKKYKKNVIVIDDEFNALDFSITIDKKQELVDSGYKKTIDFLKEEEAD